MMSEYNKLKAKVSDGVRVMGASESVVRGVRWGLLEMNVWFGMGRMEVKSGRSGK